MSVEYQIENKCSDPNIENSTTHTTLFNVQNMDIA